MAAVPRDVLADLKPQLAAARYKASAAAVRVARARAELEAAAAAHRVALDTVNELEASIAAAAAEPISPDHPLCIAGAPTDPTLWLPDELIGAILLRVPTQDVHLHCRAVCRRWAAIVAADPVARRQHADRWHLYSRKVLRPRWIDAVDEAENLAPQQQAGQLRPIRFEVVDEGAPPQGGECATDGSTNDGAESHTDTETESDSDDAVGGGDAGAFTDVLRDIASVAIAPDGSTLCTGSWDGAVRVWDPRTGRQIGQIIGHTETVSALAFAASGVLLYSGSYDSTVRVWRMGLLRNGSGNGDRLVAGSVGTLAGNSCGVTSLCSDDSAVYSGSFDGRVCVWACGLDGDECDTLAHKLSTGQRHKVVGIAVTAHALVCATEFGVIAVWSKPGYVLLHTKWCKANALSLSMGAPSAPDGPPLAWINTLGGDVMWTTIDDDSEPTRFDGQIHTGCGLFDADTSAIQPNPDDLDRVIRKWSEEEDTYTLQIVHSADGQTLFAVETEPSTFGIHLGGHVLDGDGATSTVIFKFSHHAGGYALEETFALPITAGTGECSEGVVLGRDGTLLVWHSGGVHVF